MDGCWLEPRPGSGDDAELRLRLESLWHDADALWKRFRRRREFHRFIAGDYHLIGAALCQLKPYAESFLEWGSGTGVVTIMADMIGYDAYGIEIEPFLVDWARTLADQHGSEATFVEGSFVPAEYAWSPATGDEEFHTILDEAPAYSVLGADLCEFDLVYAFPWPEEANLFEDIMRQCGGDNSLLLTYHEHDGLRLSRKRPRHRVR